MTAIFDIDFRNVPVVPVPCSRETLGSDIRPVLAAFAGEYHDVLFGSGLFDLRASEVPDVPKGGRPGLRETRQLIASNNSQLLLIFGGKAPSLRYESAYPRFHCLCRLHHLAVLRRASGLPPAT